MNITNIILTACILCYQPAQLQICPLPSGCRPDQMVTIPGLQYYRDAALFLLHIVPQAGVEPLRISIEARPGVVEFICLQAESDLGGWQQTCWEQTSTTAPIHSTWMVLEAGMWTIRLRVHTDGRVLASTNVVVLEKGDMP